MHRMSLTRTLLFVSLSLFSLLVSTVHCDCRLLAIGDIHGDLENALLILRTANVIDNSNHWIAGCTTLIQTGDILDRGASSLAALNFFHQLMIEAKKYGGEVKMLLGNHELMNFEGTVRYVNPEELKSVGGEATWVSLFSSGGLFRRWLERLPAAVLVNGTVFVHAGIMPAHAALGIDAINRLVKLQLKRGQFNQGLLSVEGPLWTRKLIHGAMAKDCSLLEMSLSFLSAKRMVVGHTIQDDHNIRSYCDGKLLAIDVAISRAISGAHPGCVEFIDGEPRAIYVQR